MIGRSKKVKVTVFSLFKGGLPSNGKLQLQDTQVPSTSYHSLAAICSLFPADHETEFASKITMLTLWRP